MQEKDGGNGTYRTSLCMYEMVVLGTVNPERTLIAVVGFHRIHVIVHHFATIIHLLGFPKKSEIQIIKIVKISNYIRLLYTALWIRTVDLEPCRRS